MQYRFSEYLLDTGRFALYRGECAVEVEPQVLKFLIYLIEHRDRVISRDELLGKLFGRRVVTDNALTVRIRAARQAVGDDSNRQAMIATVHGRGYRFVADVKTSARLSLATPAPKPGSIAETSAPDRPGFAEVQPSIAILPFESIGGADDERIIARGVAHDVTTRVARTRSLFVIARGSSFQYPSGANDVGEVGRQLGVRYVCQGAVQIQRGQLRLTVGLADTDSRREIWSAQYDRVLTDFLALQEELAMSIVNSVDEEVRRNEMNLSVALPPSHLGAWTALHRGLNHMYAFRVSECDVAEAFFRRSVDLDPKLARPYAGISFVNYERAYLNLDDRRSYHLRKAFDLAKQAIDTDPVDPMGHWVESRAHFLNGTLDQARVSAARACELNPSYANAQYLLGWIALQQGDRELAYERSKLASRLSPRDPLIYGMRGITAASLALMGRAAEAEALADDVISTSDLHYQAYAFGVVVYGLAESSEKAAQCLSKVYEVNPSYTADDYFAVCAFENDEDIQQIRRAFREAERAM